MKKSKKAISFGYPTYVFLILILTLGTSYGDVNNVLTNPGFESSATGNWTARSCTYARTTSQKYSGSYSGRASSRTATWQGIQQNVLGKMVIDQTYAVSGWVRTSTSANSDVHLTFQKTDGSGTTYSWAASGTASNSGWTYISGSYTLTVNGTLTELLVYVEGPASGIDIYLDDANVFGQVPATAGPNVAGQVNFNVTHQTLEGFGAAGAYYENWLTAHPNKSQVYDILFGQLGLDIYRLRNTYDQDSGTDYMSRSDEIVTAAGTSLGRPIKILISAWSPPAYLKSNNDTNGYPSPATLKKDANGVYVYGAYADWWADSITAWSGYGINADYISMQNEPDYEATWDSCRYEPAQTTSYASYNQAFEAVYNELYSRMGSSMPKMLAPEATGFNGASGSNLATYVSSLTNQSHVYGYAHHLYNPGNGGTPDGYLAAMASFAASYGSKPLFQTEYSYNNTTFADAMNLAILMHNALTVESVASYMYWDLFWETPGGLVSFPSYGSASYTINPVYYAFKHYSKFTDPNWQRIDANTTSSSDLRISAYKDPCEPNAAIVIINTSTTTDVNLTLSLSGFNPQNSGIYQSKSNANFAYIGTFNTSTPVFLPKQSITTIHLAGIINCADVQAGGYKLDSDLNSDCYVDYEDLAIIAYYWLHTDCIAPGNCQGADFAPTDGTVDFFDFADFGPEWMQCNNPQDAGCTPNW